MGFTDLALPLYRELQQRVNVGVNPGDVDDLASCARNERLRLLVAKAHRLAGLGMREFARMMRYIAPVWHFLPVQRKTLCDYVRFALDDAEAAAVMEPERMMDMKMIFHQLQLSGYSQDLFSVPETALLVERLDRYLENANASTVNLVFFAPDDPRPVESVGSDTSRMLEDLLLSFDRTSSTWVDHFWEAS
ncbi:hypothetical protein DFH08DRAFT_907035 [Mycena albidolilacea]|uniref:Uncharacterized protein n=1 Tax=Mycena albidolilacea TaxID=1033008 RepID=A0AAD6YXN7_9AGAR|nr:hypothetical protein DFH08DRAFT_907035 [Mycena albidolilacea]